MTTVAFTINGKPASVDANADTPLLWIIREHLKLTGTKFGCGAGLCGACTVHLDGKAVRSCQTQMLEVANKEKNNDDRRPVTEFQPSVAESVDCRAGAAMRLLSVGPNHAGRLSAVEAQISDARAESSRTWMAISAAAAPIRALYAPFSAPLRSGVGSHAHKHIRKDRTGSLSRGFVEARVTGLTFAFTLGGGLLGRPRRSARRRKRHAQCLDHHRHGTARSRFCARRRKWARACCRPLPSSSPENSMPIGRRSTPNSLRRSRRSTAIRIHSFTGPKSPPRSISVSGYFTSLRVARRSSAPSVDRQCRGHNGKCRRRTDHRERGYRHSRQAPDAASATAMSRSSPPSPSPAEDHRSRSQAAVAVQADRSQRHRARQHTVESQRAR